MYRTLSALTVDQNLRMIVSMTKSGLPKSARIFLRRAKSRFRREILDAQEAERKIKDLVEGMMKRYTKERKSTKGLQDSLTPVH